MYQSLENLSKYFSDNKIKELLEKSISYKKIILDEEDNEIIFNGNYTKDHLLTVLTNIKESIELTNYKINDDIIFLLNLVNKYRTEILLNKADNLLIKKRVFTLVKLENSDKSNTGYNIEIDIELFRNYLDYNITEIHKSRHDTIRYIFIVSIWLYFVYRMMH